MGASRSGLFAREILDVAKDARAFAELTEGQRVLFHQDGSVRRGVLVEKCRFGALIETDSGAVVGVAFRRVALAQ
jgi:hypothetical protein